MNTIVFVGEHPRTYDVRWHQHENWELVYCTGGEGVFSFQSGEEIRYHQGQTVAIPPGLVHMNSSVNGFTNIHINMTEPSFPNKSAFMVNDDPEGHMKIAFSEAKFYYLSDIRRQELVMDALGDLISGYMVVFYDNRDLSSAVEQLRAAVLSNYSDPAFDLEKTLTGLPFSYDYLRKLFQKEMGMTPLKYMTELRMKKARAILTADRNGDYSMAELAENCGFSDPLYFSRVFTKYYGCSPRAFAKKLEDREMSEN